MSVFGLWSGVMPGEIELADDGLSAVFTPARPFSAGERVTVSVAKSIKGLDGTTMARGYAWHFMIATSFATLSPTETTRISVRRKGEGWIQTYGAFAGDFNEDGYTDLAVPNERSNDFRLFLNDGNGFYHRFDTYPIPAGNRPSVNEGADFDMDGHMDYVVGNSTGATIGLFMGDGDGALLAGGTFSVGLGVRGLAVLDLNGDNYPDVATASRQADVVSTLINDGAGSFLSATTYNTPAEGETAAAAADMNEDGIMDLLVGSYFSGEMVVLLGDGNGKLTLLDRFPVGERIWMIAAGDVNGDGHSDVVTANSDDATVSVLMGDGTGRLGSPAAYSSDNFTIAIDLGDLDGDGDLDMVSSNFGSTNVGSRTGSWMVFENDGTGKFNRRSTYRASGAGSCAVLHDRNNDGTLDITAIDELQDELVLFTNRPVSTSEAESELPDSDFAVAVYPNPIRNSGTIQFGLDAPSYVLIELFDVAGRRLATVYEGTKPAGIHRHAIDSELRDLPSGSYFLSVSVARRRASVEIQKVR